MSNLHGYHFGGCCACRAPFLPGTDFFYEPDCQAVYYLQCRFRRLTQAGSPSDFTGPVDRGHMLTCAHYSFAYAFAQTMPYDSINTAMKKAAVGDALENGVNCMTQRQDTRGSRGAGAGGAVDGPPDDADAVVAVGDAVAAGRSAAEIARVALATRKARDEASAQWELPASYPHPLLAAFLSGDGCKNALDVDIDFTAPICKLCNAIFDTWARMGNLLTLPSMVPPHTIRATPARARGGAAAEILLPDGGKQATRNNLGLILGHYMHRCLRGLRGTPACEGALKNHRPYVCMMLFIPLHLTCFFLECKEGTIAQKRKGQGKGVHNYMGCMDLLIAYYLYLCARTEDNTPGSLDFIRFSVFYIKELPDAPKPVWDSAVHETLSDFVFDKDRPADHVALVAYASDRLMTLYTEKCKPLLRLIKGVPLAPGPGLPSPMDTAAAAFFVSAKEFDTALAAHFDQAHTPSNITYYIQHIGIAAIVWHIRRYLLSETPRLRELLDEWTRSLLVKEWTNIVQNSPYDLTMSQAQLIYQMQNVLLPERLLGSADALGTGVELTLIRTIDRDPIVELIAECGRCSVFKAAARLSRWNFVSKAPPPLYGLESRLAPFSARLISLRSDMIAASDRSSDPRGTAANCAARRRGCRGR